MKAIVKIKPEKGIWMADVPMPVVGPNDVLIKVKILAVKVISKFILEYDLQPVWILKQVQDDCTNDFLDTLFFVPS